MIGRTVFRRDNAAGHECLTVTLFRSMWDRWAFALLPAGEYQGDPYEAQLSVTWLLWRVTVWWAR